MVGAGAKGRHACSARLMNDVKELDLIEPASLTHITVPAPQTVLISRNVTIGKGCVLWPGTVLLADICGKIVIGEAVEIGFEGGFTIDARGGPGIFIGGGARLLGGGSLSGANRVGNGAQILGPIRCQRCYLADGGSYLEPDPDKRGAVLKGSGVARDIKLGQGQVIQAFGLFKDAAIRRQLEFHPRS